ncbi:uridine kinase family protein [Nocardioides jensenii]|uniref:uridine kinase family protein n=1 Tax=Nocardioides jensenii TaxID=1843 RepID=UPI0012F9CD77|nr:AAA family ATPase [Nocardioides jensenii]
MAGVVADVLTHARSGPGLLSGNHLICIDGPTGSGKTTLAAALAEAAPQAHVLHMDDMYAGWSGLNGDTGARLREQVMVPLAAGEPGHYRRYDWHQGDFAELHLVPPTALLVLEGVGSGDLALAPWRSTLVWVSAPDDLRLERGLARDRALHSREGEPWDEADHRAKLTGFMADERRFFAAHGLPGTADLRVDGTGPWFGGAGPLP